MSEQFKNDAFSGPQPNQPDLVALIRKLEDHLVILERKIDGLINKQQEHRRPFQEQRFSKPFRPSFKGSHHGKGEYNSHSRENKFAPGQNFKKHNDGEHKSFGDKKKPYFFKKKYQK